MDSPELSHMAEHFYGYGRWDAPFWFIGPEPGGTQGDGSLEKRYQSWKGLGFESVVDCAPHHRGFGFTKWHQPLPPTQSTWRQLIRLLLEYKGINPTLDSIREYQRDHWGSENGETCVIELSGLASPSLGTPQDRTAYLSKRIGRIRQEALKRSPMFIVMYGVGQRDEWRQIVGGIFDSNGICRIGKTVAAIAAHPVSRGLGSDYWVTSGTA